jgi:pimeloyl-ACP methyl ester carboxylesterase
MKRADMRGVFLAVLSAFVLFCEGSDASEPIPLNDRATNRNAEYALIFIHGILGSGGSSTKSGSFGKWPEIISKDLTTLPDHGKISDIAVYAMDYSNTFQTTTNLSEIAFGVADSLSHSQIFERHRHVWIVAHSMGGIVVKRVLTRWHNQGKDVLIGRVLGVGMLGVPAAGSPIADLVKSFGVDRIAEHFGWNGGLLNDLVTNSGSYLDTVDGEWRDLREIRDGPRGNSSHDFSTLVSCGYETKNEIERTIWTGTVAWVLSAFGWTSVDNIDFVVPKLYSENTWCDTRRALPFKHTDLASPLNEEAEQHSWLRALLIDSINRNRNLNYISFGSGPAPNLITDPTAHSVAHIVELFNEDIINDTTGLPRNPERLKIPDELSAERAKGLVLTGGQFEKSTATYAWLEARKKNNCLDIEPTDNRMEIQIKISADLKSCSGKAMVCKDNSCD